jgi:cytoskeletal protein RodZ
MRRFAIAVVAAIATLGISAAVVLAAQQPNSANRSQVSHNSGSHSEQETAQPSQASAQNHDVDEEDGTNNQSEAADEQEGPNNQSTVNEHQQGANHHGNADHGNTNRSQNSGHDD